ncbi:hypothetical protein SNEBB_002903 [Seison nebaliae]|nr:hypothetical protein SNEBB_002903 [Seison nebaliae]
MINVSIRFKKDQAPNEKKKNKENMKKLSEKKLESKLSANDQFDDTVQLILPSDKYQLYVGKGELPNKLNCSLIIKKFNDSIPYLSIQIISTNQSIILPLSFFFDSTEVNDTPTNYDKSFTLRTKLSWNILFQKSGVGNFKFHIGNVAKSENTPFQSRNVQKNFGISSSLHLLKLPLYSLDLYERFSHHNKWSVIKNDFCETYPKLLLLPKELSVFDIRNSCSFRSATRFPVATFIHENSTSLCRSSQPILGFSGSTTTDCSLLHHIIRTNMTDQTVSKKLMIMDTRPLLNVVANRARGKGTEKLISKDFPAIDFESSAIDNIHVMRTSFEEFSTVIHQTLTSDSDNRKKIMEKIFSSSMTSFTFTDYFNGIKESDWFTHLDLVLRTAYFVANKMENDFSHVLVHCSDGWDRTSQCTSLTQILLSPHSRTMNGFMELIDKDWIQFGHKFYDRCQLLAVYNPKEYSPIFTQFLDCVWQLQNQYPQLFEFNNQFIRDIYHLHLSNLFPNFLRSRLGEDQRENMNDIWNHLQLSYYDYLNPFEILRYDEISNNEEKAVIELLDEQLPYRQFEMKEENNFDVFDFPEENLIECSSIYESIFDSYDTQTSNLSKITDNLLEQLVEQNQILQLHNIFITFLLNIHETLMGDDSNEEPNDNLIELSSYLVGLLKIYLKEWMEDIDFAMKKISVKTIDHQLSFSLNLINVLKENNIEYRKNSFFSWFNVAYEFSSWDILWRPLTIQLNNYSIHPTTSNGNYLMKNYLVKLDKKLSEWNMKLFSKKTIMKYDSFHSLFNFNSGKKRCWKCGKMIEVKLFDEQSVQLFFTARYLMNCSRFHHHFHLPVCVKCNNELAVNFPTVAELMNEYEGKQFIPTNRFDSLRIA